jgi:DNA mismatch repair protein MutS
MPLFQPAEQNPALDALQALDADNLSPREALQALYRLHDLARQELHS